ncbi:MAG: serine/threonine-protein kinase [Planctomycetota bacterium]|nr:serine/threonine-protein kinase [Planctomycetota bacterium]
MTGDKVGEEICLTLPATIGRHPKASVVIRDTGSSRYHTRIVSTGAGARLEDLKSRNGTYLNGRRVQSSRIVHGDSIRIGGTVLGVVDDRGLEWVGKTIGEFEVLSRTDRLPSAAEFRASQPSMGREVTLLMLDEDLSGSPREEILYQSRLAGKIRSTAALRIYDIAEVEDRTLIISEPPSGVPLEELLRMPGGCDLHFLAEVGIQLANLATAANDHGVFLRGLDPRHVYLGEQGEVKVAHIGLGKGLSRERHVSPEERAGVSRTRASDVFVIASLLSEGKGGSPSLQKVLAKAMAEDPGRRHGTPEDLSTDLGRALKAPTARPPTPVRRDIARDPPADLGLALRFVRGAAFSLFLATLFFLSAQVVRVILR